MSVRVHGEPVGRRVGLVACSGRKRTTRAAAADLYTGALFVKARRYVELTCPDGWHVLSALHGLVDPSTEVDPYDHSMRDVADAAAWAERVNVALLGRYHDGRPTTFYVIAGADYRTPLVPRLAVWADVRELLTGLGYGAQMSALDSAARAHVPGLYGKAYGDA